MADDSKHSPKQGTSDVAPKTLDQILATLPKPDKGILAQEGFVPDRDGLTDLREERKK